MTFPANGNSDPAAITVGAISSACCKGERRRLPERSSSYVAATAAEDPVNGL